MKVEFREVNEDDEELIWNIVYVTADMEKSGETIEQAKQNPDRRRYICDWGKPFDYGIIAQTSGVVSIFVGAAWMRLLKIENKGAGMLMILPQSYPLAFTKSSEAGIERPSCETD